MIISKLKHFESKGKTISIKEKEVEILEKMVPEICKDKLDNLAAGAVSPVGRQVIQCSDLGMDTLSKAITRPDSLGYFTGFISATLECKGYKDERLKIPILQVASNFLFGGEGQHEFLKICDLLGTKDDEYIKGLKKGYLDAVELAESENEPEGLRMLLTSG